MTTMKLHAQPTPELARLDELIEVVPVAMMTTQDAAGALVSRRVRLFAMVASAVTGKPPALGGHGSFDHLSPGTSTS
jgi:hypothetical protein